MAQSQAELESTTAELLTETFNVFAEDIATMFDTEVSAQQLDITVGTIKEVKDTYKKLAAVCSVTAEGPINGQFHVIFDKDGLFTVSGTFVMQPEQIITKNRKNGTEEEAKEIGDALGEVGNLFVGSCDRVFREEMEEHGHFAQSGTFIGNPWTGSEDKIGLTAEEEMLILEFEMTVAPLEPFKCGVLLPKTIFEPPAEKPAAEEAPEESAEAPAEEAAEATETPAEETPAEDTETAETPAEETPAEEAVTEETPAEEPDAPVEDTETAEETPAEETPAEDTETPAEETPAEEAPAGPVSEAIHELTTNESLPLPILNADASEVLNAVTAAQVMKSPPAWAKPDNTVEQITAIMQQHDAGYIMIGTDGKLEGIVSKSDLRGALSPYLQSMFVKWRGPMDLATLQIKAQWVMSRPVRTVRPDATLYNVVKTMTEHGGRCMPVVDQDGKVHGIVTVFDIFKVLLNASPDAQSSGNTTQAPPLA